MDGGGVIERQMEALARMLAMLAAMAGLFQAARLRLPPDVHHALLAPLRLAEDAASAVLVSECGLPLAFGPLAAARLRRCLVLLCRTIATLRRRLLRPSEAAPPAPAHDVRAVPDLRDLSNRAPRYPDTS